MKNSKLILCALAVLFLAFLPVLWVTAELAADLRAFHPVAGWAVWLATAAALVAVIWPIVGMCRLPELPDRNIWSGELDAMDLSGLRNLARQLVASSPRESDQIIELRRVLDYSPVNLRQALEKEIQLRKEWTQAMRAGCIRQSAFLSVLSPHGRMDMLLLWWINMRQIYLIGRSYGFRPNPRGMLVLYGKVFTASVVVEVADEIGTELLAEISRGVIGDLPFLKQAAGITGDAIKSAVFTGYVGLLTEFLLLNELEPPDTVKRRSFRKEALNTALSIIKKSTFESVDAEPAV